MKEFKMIIVRRNKRKNRRKSFDIFKKGAHFKYKISKSDNKK